MINYFSFKTAWQYAEVGELNPELFLNNPFWCSMLKKDEIEMTVNLIQAFFDAKTFSDFLSVAEYSTKTFAYIFDREESEIQNWVQKTSVFPVRMKKSYAFMIITNKIAYNRQRTCLCCGEAFVASKDEVCCDSCRTAIEKNQINAEDSNTIKFQIELVCKT